MKNKYILLLLIMAITACSTAKKIAIGQGSVVQLPKNARQLSKEEFEEQNKKFPYSPLPANDNQYLADNVLISFYNIKTIMPPHPERTLQDMKKAVDIMIGWDKSSSIEKTTLATINNNQVFIWRIKGETSTSISFHCRDMSNKLTWVGTVEVQLADSTKADNVVAYMTSHVKFGQ